MGTGSSHERYCYVLVYRRHGISAVRWRVIEVVLNSAARQVLKQAGTPFSGAGELLFSPVTKELGRRVYELSRAVQGDDCLLVGT